MIEMNRETMTLTGVLIALATCVYLYKELQKVQQQQQRSAALAVQTPPPQPPTVVMSQAPVNDAKESPEMKKED